MVCLNVCVQMMVCVIIAGVDSRVIIQSSMSAVSDQRQQSSKKMRRLKLNNTRPLLFHDYNNNNDNMEDMDLQLSWLSIFKERHLISTPSNSSPAPSPGGVDVVPDISRLDFRRFSARTRSLRGSKTLSETVDHPVRRFLTGRRSAVSEPTIHTVDRPSANPEWRIAIPAAAVFACFVAGLLLTLIAVCVRRRNTKNDKNTALHETKITQ